MNIDIMFLIEMIAVGFNLLYVILAALQKKSCWIFGGIGCLLSVWLFYKAKLPSEAFLYFFYFVMAVIGFFNWIKNDQLKIRTIDLNTHIQLIISGLALTGGFYLFSSYLNGVRPGLDALTTGFSIVATYMVIRKILENWIYWIIIDLVTAYLYFTREVNLYALLMVAYTALAIYGYFKWKNEIESNYSDPNVLDIE